MVGIVILPHPSIAAAAKKAATVAAPSIAADSSKPSLSLAKFFSRAGKVVQKVLYGVNDKSAARMLKKAGDTRAEISGYYRVLFIARDDST